MLGSLFITRNCVISTGHLVLLRQGNTNCSDLSLSWDGIIGNDIGNEMQEGTMCLVCSCGRCYNNEEPC